MTNVKIPWLLTKVSLWRRRRRRRRRTYGLIRLSRCAAGNNPKIWQMWRYHGYLRKSAYEEGGEGGEPTVLLDSAAARLVKTKSCNIFPSSFQLAVFTFCIRWYALSSAWRNSNSPVSKQTKMKVEIISCFWRFFLPASSFLLCFCYNFTFQLPRMKSEQNATF